jgi:hypothetical protein
MIDPPVVFDIVLPAADFDEPQKRELRVKVGDRPFELIDLLPNCTLAPDFEVDAGTTVVLKLADFGSVKEFVDLQDPRGYVYRNRMVKRDARIDHDEVSVVVTRALPWCPAGRLGVRVRQDGQQSLVTSFQDEGEMAKIVSAQSRDMPEEP